MLAKLVPDTAKESCLGIQSRDLVLIFIGERLEPCADRRPGELAAAGNGRLCAANPLDQCCEARGQFVVLVAGQELHAALDRFVQ